MTHPTSTSRTTLEAISPGGSTCTVQVTDGWEVVAEPGIGVPWVALPAETDSGFRANLVLTVSDVDSDLEEWQRSAETLLEETLHSYRAIDLAWEVLAGTRALRRLAHHVVDGQGVTLEQWSVLGDRTGWTISGTAADSEYAGLAAPFGEVASSLRIVAAGASR